MYRLEAPKSSKHRTCSGRGIVDLQTDRFTASETIDPECPGDV